MRAGRLVVACAVAALVLVPASASGAREDASCDWGASSITAHVVGGRVVESAPVTTGCSR